MKHFIQSHDPLLYAEERIRYSWTKNPATAKKRLLAAYKQFKGPVRWEKFPVEHTWAQVTGLPNPRQNYYVYRGQEVTPSRFMTFDAVCFDIEEETFEPGVELPYGRYGLFLGKAVCEYLTHEFHLPFRPSNADFILSGPPVSLRGTEAVVLLDKAQEEGLAVDRDFQFKKTSRYITVVSDAMRLFLVEHIGEWEEFDMVLRVSHPKQMRLSFYIDDLKESP